MHRNVERLIGRLATDPQLRRRFAATPETLLRELSENGFELTALELETLAATPVAAFSALAGALDARLRRLEPTATESGDDLDPIHPLNTSSPKKEFPQ